MSKLNTLNDLFLNELRDVYDAEQQILDALPDLIDEVTAPRLKAALQEHLGQTQTHVHRLEQAFEALGEQAKAKKCQAMRGLVKEGAELASENGDPAVLDAAIIAAAQKVEHYEIATYGALATWAELLQENEVAELLKATIGEEKQADDTLKEIAKADINLRAAA